MVEREVILTAITDPKQLEVLARDLSKEGYKVVSALNLKELMDAIEKEGKIAMAVVDVAAFDEDIWKQLETLRNSDIPFFVISPHKGSSVQNEILKHGASGLFSKGLRIKELIEYIHSLLGK
jgi:DNA-binding response OmpR family regulator